MKIERHPHGTLWAAYVAPPATPKLHSCVEFDLASPNGAEARLSRRTHHWHWCVYITLRYVLPGNCCDEAEEAHG